jgi:glycosyltransferase involved in cell wall biosynthesis
LIFPQDEDYGITPIESIASGRPVIGYNKGGILETMIPYKSSNEKATALLFDDQTEESLIEALQKFESIDFDSEFIKSHSENFDVEFFKKRIKEIVYSY